MSSNAARVFEDRPATREQTPLLIGLIGPSGSGKTFSALRLATGIQRVAGGEIYVIDTEARRSLHYADKFRFRHVAFGAPFSPLDYLAAIEHCVAKGAKTIVVDSMSHEHEGPGGVLEEHDVETKRLAAAWKVSESKAQLSAWGPPKMKRRRLINSILQMSVNFIFCFRAKEKLKIEPGKDPVNLGFMPIAGEEFVYEMVAKCLLLPGANGVPTWISNNTGEKMMIKIPEQFRTLFAEPVQLSESVGQSMATWAAGTAAPEALPVDELLGRYAACSDDATYRTLEDSRRFSWSKTSKDDKARLKEAADATVARMASAARFAETSTIGSNQGSDDPEPGSEG